MENYSLLVKMAVKPEKIDPFVVVAKLECHDKGFEERMKSILPQFVIAYRYYSSVEKMFRKQNRSKVSISPAGTLGLLFKDQEKSLLNIMKTDGLTYVLNNEEELEPLYQEVHQALQMFIHQENQVYNELKDRSVEYSDK